MPDVVEYPRRQRIAAYALITRPGQNGQDEILMTRLSPHIRFKGWTLPGGGVDHGEDPREALRREIYEETGLDAEPGRVVDVHSTHFTGARPDGVVEDYHGIHLIFEAVVDAESAAVDPRVIDVGGSTDESRWMTLDQARALSLTAAAKHALGVLEEGP